MEKVFNDKAYALDSVYRVGGSGYAFSSYFSHYTVSFGLIVVCPQLLQRNRWCLLPPDQALPNLIRRTE